MDTTALHYAGQTVNSPPSSRRLDDVATTGHHKVSSLWEMATIIASLPFYLILFERQQCVDDTLFFDESLEKHWWRPIQFPTVLGHSGVFLNPSKFEFAQR